MTKLVLAVAAVATALVGCSGASGNEDLQVNDVGQAQGALAAPAPSGGDTTGDGADANGEVGDHDCQEGDKDGHDRHHRHKFSALDALDGVKDHQITIANLPPGLPDRLLAKLHAIDTNGDGIVTKAEVKAFRKAHHHGDHDRQGENENEQSGG